MCFKTVRGHACCKQTARYVDFEINYRLYSDLGIIKSVSKEMSSNAVASLTPNADEIRTIHVSNADI